MKSSTDHGDTTFDSSLDILGSRWRRGILVLLLEVESLAVEDLPDRLDVEGDLTRCRIRLHHADLPKLASAGHLAWDRERGRIRRGRAFDEVRPLLELLVENGDELQNGRR